MHEKQLKYALESKGYSVNLDKSLSFCQGCVEGKFFRRPFKPVGEVRAKKRLELIHSDVRGPFDTQSFLGKRYFITFIDDYSRCTAVYFMKLKSEALEKF